MAQFSVRDGQPAIPAGAEFAGLPLQLHCSGEASYLLHAAAGWGPAQLVLLVILAIVLASSSVMCCECTAVVSQ